MSLRKLRVKVDREVMIRNLNSEMWTEDEPKSFQHYGATIDPIFELFKLEQGAKIWFHNVPLHLFKDSYLFSHPNPEKIK